MNRGVILMTGLPISLGHLQFVRWASNFGLDELYVLVCSRPTDPVDVKDRANAVREEFSRQYFSNTSIIVVEVVHNYPDYPEQFDGPIEEFDRLWVDEIRYHIDFDSEDILFASDTYGARFARNLGLKFIPYDPYRETVKISGTKIRKDPFNNFRYISPYLQRKFRQTVTVFGAESTGKTTMAKKLAEKYDSPYVPEWARPYLETLESPEVTDERMRTIICGQAASQYSVKALLGNPFIFQDTDLYSTLGYYRIYGGGTADDIQTVLDEAYDTQSDFYIVMNSNIRFTPDPLRYGGNVRESNDKFWLDILDEFGLPYHYVKSTNPIAQEEEVFQAVEDFFYEQNPVFGFKRLQGE